MIRKETIRLLISEKRALVGTILFLLIFLAAILAPYFATHDPNAQSLAEKNASPFWVEGANREYILGTDSLGRDIYSRLVYGARVAIIVGVISAVLSALIGVALGLASGYYRGKVDDIIMRVVDMWMSIPPVLTALVLMAILGIGIQNVIIAVVIVEWTRFARVIRSEVLSIREKDFVSAAVLVGLSDFMVIKKEILPNVLPLIYTITTITMSLAITVEALLSFIGFGVEASIPSWGSMIALGMGSIRVQPWAVLLPMITIIIAIIGLNLLGDGLRRISDPRLRGG